MVSELSGSPRLPGKGPLFLHINRNENGGSECPSVCPSSLPDEIMTTASLCEAASGKTAA